MGPSFYFQWELSNLAFISKKKKIESRVILSQMKSSNKPSQKSQHSPSQISLMCSVFIGHKHNECRPKQAALATWWALHSILKLTWPIYRRAPCDTKNLDELPMSGWMCTSMDETYILIHKSDFTTPIIDASSATRLSWIFFEWKGEKNPQELALGVGGMLLKVALQ